MKKKELIIMMLFVSCLLIADFIILDPVQLDETDYTFHESYGQTNSTTFQNGLLVKQFHDKDFEISYEGNIRNHDFDNSRDLLLRLHFNDRYPNFKIINDEYYISSTGATWIDTTTAEIYVPSGIYKIYTSFYVDHMFKVVIRYDVDLTIGSQINEIWIDHNEATNLIELNGKNIYGEPFDMSEKYYVLFIFQVNNDSKYIAYETNGNQMMISDVLEGFDFVAGELKFDENKIQTTQYGPIQEITSNLSFSNESTDYIHQQILLQIPEVNEELKISVGNTLWANGSLGNPIYMSSSTSADLFECNEDQWSTDLYMMYHNYEHCGTTTMIGVGYVEDMYFNKIYTTAPFHCINDKIGSFWNSIPIIVDYLSPEGEQLVFGEAPIFIEVNYGYFENLLYVGTESMGFNRELRIYDRYISTFILTDSNGNIIEEGGLENLLGIDLPEDTYTLIIENDNFNLAGLPGLFTITNCFNTELDLFAPPYINSFSIFNEDNKPVNRLEHNEDASLLFSVADVEYIDSLLTYLPVITESVKVFYKIHDEEEWQEIETELIDEIPVCGWTFGKIFSTNLLVATALDSTVYDLKIQFEDNEENSTEMIIKPAFVVGDFSATSISEQEIMHNYLADQYVISNYPNPFNPTTTIALSISEESGVELSIYNLKGQKIKTLLNDRILAGEHSIIWNGEDDSGKIVSSGVYLYKLNVNNRIEAVKKCLLMK